MQEQRRCRRMVVQLALILGVLGMHALVMPPMTWSVGTPATTVADTAMAGAPTGHAHADAASMLANLPEPQAVAVTAAGTAMSASAPADGEGPSTPVAMRQAGSDPMPPMPAHGMAHLCLAVLAAALALALVAALLTAISDPPGTVTLGGSGRVRAAPRRPPPDHGTRLAELCVLRN